MAIIIKTEYPNALLDKIYKTIETKEAGKWLITSDGRITRMPLLWRNEAFFKPEIWIDENELRFGLLKRKDRRHITTKLYTVFHTKFIEMLLSNFDKDFKEATITALSTPPDNF